MRQKANITIFILLTFCSVTVSAQSKSPENGRPNIIYILADDLGIGDLSIYNENSKIKTPNLDKLGSQGMVFTDAHTSHTWWVCKQKGRLTMSIF